MINSNDRLKLKWSIKIESNLINIENWKPFREKVIKNLDTVLITAQPVT